MIEKYLILMGKMLKRRERPQFKADLRSQLLQKADTLERSVAQAKKEPATPVKEDFDWRGLLSGGWFVRGLAPATAAVLLLAVVFQFVLPGAGIIAPTLVDIAAAKDYYVLTPETEDETGVTSESTFILSSKGEIDASEVEEVLTVEPAVELLLEQISDTEILVTPADDLEPGTVYSFELEAQYLNEAPYPKEFNWAYEISDGFRVMGTLPGNEEAGVPVNSSIEVYFTHNGVSVEDFEAAFSIFPAVSGSLEVNGKTAVFAPSGGLSETTVYRVTIDGGLQSASGEKTLKDDYVFQFETSDEERTTTQLSFSKNIYEFNPSEAPSFRLYYYEDGGEEDETIALGVYEYASGEDFAKALQAYSEAVPSWCYYQNKVYRAPTDGLNKIADEADFSITDEDGKWIHLPSGLSEGYYLAQVQKNGETAQVFLQISNTAVYLNLNRENSLVWVNDIVTGEPVESAEVSVNGGPFSAQTNADGLAVFENLYDALGYEESAYDSLLFSVQTETFTTYYDPNFYHSLGRENDLYWSMLQTERQTYQPTDKVYYWGFVQGREEPIPEEAELYIVQGWWHGDEGREGNDVVYEETLSLKDGSAFEGAIEINKYAPGYYALVIIQDGKVISETDFTVKSYVKPAYQIVAEADKTALFVGDAVHITLTVRFFEGTPVANTDLRIFTPDGEEKIMATDVNGQITLDWVASVESMEGCDTYCPLSDYRYFSASPVQEELGEIEAGLEFRVFQSRTVLDVQSDDLSTSEMNFEAYEVDLEKVDYDLLNIENHESIHGGRDASASVEVIITKRDWIEEVVGETYDEVDKVVRKEYDSVLHETVVREETITSNENGEFHYEPNLEEGFDYEISFFVLDSMGGQYEDRNNLSGYDWSGGSYEYLNLSSNHEDGLYSLDEQVNVTAESSSEEVSLEEIAGTYLFAEEKAGVLNYSVVNKPTYTFSFGEDHVPNVTVDAVMFDGQHYWHGSTGLTLDTSDRRLTIDVTPDQEEYEPGETVKLSVNTGEAAEVNLYLVEEAYYALFAQNFNDPLELLYEHVGTGVDSSYLSHKAVEFSGDKGGCFVAGTQILMVDGSSKSIENISIGDFVLTKQSEWSPLLVPVRVLNTTAIEVGETMLVNSSFGLTEEHVLFLNGQWQVASEMNVGDVLLNSKGGNVAVESIDFVKENVWVYNFETEDKHTYFADGYYVHNEKGGVRSDFRDTALFTLVETDSSGRATVEFELPDNITSWRLSAAAVSGGDEIRAGYTSINIDVSKDVFVNPVINSSYLTGDAPSIPVRAYGDSLAAGDPVNFSLNLDEVFEEEKVGSAFETTYFDLPEFSSTGEYILTTSASAEGSTDIVELQTTVVDSHMSMNAISETILSEDMELEGSDTDRTDVYFINNEVGPIYNVLLQARYEEGDRVDQMLARTLGAAWLNAYFEENLTVYEFPSFVYQNIEEDGGVGLLPYSDSDLVLTAKLAALAPEQFSVEELRAYFESILHDPERTLNEKILSLYGLASLGDAYLTELNYFVSNFELSPEDKLYAALAYGEYGDEAGATELLLELTGEEFDAQHSVLLATAMETVGSNQSEILWTTQTAADAAVLEKLLYAQARLERGAQSEVSFKINGDKVSLTGNEIYRKSLLPEELATLRFLDFSGEVLALTSYQIPFDLETVETDGRVSITRTYKVDEETVTSVSVGDIMEVHIRIDLPSSLRNSSFKVTDYLPSGLQTVTWADSVGESVGGKDSDYRRPYLKDGQALNFFVSCYKGNCYGETFYYLARVINPGNFVGEPASVQNFEDPSVFNLTGERSTMVIE